MFRTDRNRLRIPALFFIAVVCASGVCPFSAAARQEGEHYPALGKIRRSNSVAIDCSACPRALAKAGTTAQEVLADWDRFRLVNDPKQADLVFIFSANPYLGDYVTRNGPDKRPVMIDGTIMTIVDPHTGQELWTSSRRWGSWRVASATKDLIEELRHDMEGESRKWSVEEVLRCSGTPAYQAFAFLAPEAALTKPELGASRIEDAPDRLRIGSSSAPEFCRRAELVIGADNRIEGFEVVASESDTLDVADVLEQADRFDFTSGKDPETQKVYFRAQATDRKVLIEFEKQGRRMILSRVRYDY